MLRSFFTPECEMCYLVALKFCVVVKLLGLGAELADKCDAWSVVTTL